MIVLKQTSASMILWLGARVNVALGMVRGGLLSWLLGVVVCVAAASGGWAGADDAGTNATTKAGANQTNAGDNQTNAGASQSNKPNFVIFFSDDHSPADCEAYGATDVKTPNMAKLAARGMLFTRSFCASPACGPSRAALLTGLWPARNGAEPNHKNKRPDVASLVPQLQAVGYEVVAIGKVAHGAFAKDYHFDSTQGPNVGISDTDSVAKFLESRSSTKPLCLMIGTRHPHVPWTDAPTYDPATLKVPLTHVDTAATRELRAAYYTDVSKSDQLLGEVMALVEKHLPADTLVAYSSDHGAQWPRGKWNLYDSGTRIPLIVSWPGHIKPDQTTGAMVCWPDLMPTLIELAGGKVPAGIDGRSFADVLLGNATEHRERVFTTHSGDGDYNVYPIRSVRTHDWKYIRNLHPEFQHQTHISRHTNSSGLVYWQSWLDAAKVNPTAAAIVKQIVERPAEELYDLVHDPLELHNLANDPAQSVRLDEMRRELDAWIASQGDKLEVFGTPLRVGDDVTLIAPVKK